MIKVSGVVTLRLGFEVELDMTEVEFNALSQTEQNLVIEEAIDWHSELPNSDIDEIEVHDIE